jgi:hypothetical protein
VLLWQHHNDLVSHSADEEGVESNQAVASTTTSTCCACGCEVAEVLELVLVAVSNTTTCQVMKIEDHLQCVHLPPATHAPTAPVRIRPNGDLASPQRGTAQRQDSIAPNTLQENDE